MKAWGAGNEDKETSQNNDTENTMPAALIDDGYTREALLPETDRHPAVLISYRPMLAAERRRLALQTVRLAARGQAGVDAAAKLVVAAVAARLVSWDVNGDVRSTTGDIPDIKPATVAALDPHLFEQIYSAIATFNDERASAKN
jgi:hypothetical protein